MAAGQKVTALHMRKIMRTYEKWRCLTELRLADEGELALRRCAAAERPHEGPVARPCGRTDANVVLAIGLEDRRPEQSEMLDRRHPLPDEVFVGRGLGLFGAPVDPQPHHVLALQIVVLDAARGG